MNIKITFLRYLVSRIRGVLATIGIAYILGTVVSEYDESLKAYLAPTGLVSEPRGDLTCRGDLRLEVPKTV